MYNMPNIAELFHISKENDERTRLLLQSAEELNVATGLENMNFFGADINDEDMAIAIQYMREIIKCKDLEPDCGTHIGCSECLYNHFEMTVKGAFRKVRMLEKENEELRNRLKKLN